MTQARTVVIGLGNPLRRDDGIGPAVARAVRARLAGRSDVSVVESDRGGLDLIEQMEGFDRALIVDALVPSAGAPGELVELPLARTAAARTCSCAHDSDLPGALAAARAVGVRVPDDVLVLGIVAQDLDLFGETLTRKVGAAVPSAVDWVLGRLAAPGVEA